MATKLDIRDWAKHQQKLAHEFMPAVMRGVTSGALRGIGILQRRTSELAFDRGGLSQGWKHKMGPNFVRFYNDKPYAAVMEYGRRPEKRPPPTKVIIPWVRRKLGVRGDEAKSIAYVIARSIGKKGIKGKNILGGAIAELKHIIEEEVHRELDRLLLGPR